MSVIAVCNLILCFQGLNFNLIVFVTVCKHRKRAVIPVRKKCGNEKKRRKNKKRKQNKQQTKQENKQSKKTTTVISTCVNGRCVNVFKVWVRAKSW